MADFKPLKLSNDGSLTQVKPGDVISVEHGGTGATTPQRAVTNLLPQQAGNQGKFLTTDGTTVSWGTVPVGVISVGLINNQNATSGELANVSMLRFDTDSGFDLTDLGNGAVKVGMNSTFKFIQVAGQGTLTAVGLDTLNLVAGENVTITTNNLAAPQTLTISAGGTGGGNGYTGSVGFTGSQGITGFTGSQGPVGVDGSRGFTGSKGDTGMGFSIAKIYPSVAALVVDVSPTGISAGQFAIIETNDVQNTDNARLYLWDGSSYTYVTDLSGSSGLQGPPGPQGVQGSTGYTGSASTTVGPAGFTGSAGAGYTGSQGEQGPAGAVGLTGSTGAGFTGSQGVNGYTGSRGVTFIGVAPPTNPLAGDQWWSSIDGQLKIYYVDSDSAQWVDAAIGTIGVTGYTGSSGYTGSAGTLRGVPYDVMASVFGPLSESNKQMLRFLSPRSFTIEANFAGSIARADTGPVAQRVFSFRVNGALVGTVTFGAGSTTGTFSSSNQLTVTPGDVLTLTGPATADSSMSNIDFVFAGTLTG